MELVRAEVVGAFNNRLFVRLLTTALTNASVKPEVRARGGGRRLGAAAVVPAVAAPASSGCGCTARAALLPPSRADASTRAGADLPV